MFTNPSQVPCSQLMGNRGYTLTQDKGLANLHLLALRPQVLNQQVHLQDHALSYDCWTLSAAGTLFSLPPAEKKNATSLEGWGPTLDRPHTKHGAVPAPAM